MFLIESLLEVEYLLTFTLPPPDSSGTIRKLDATMMPRLLSHGRGQAALLFEGV